MCGFRCTWDSYGTTASGCIRFAKLHFLQDNLFYLSLLIGDVFDRVMQREELNTFFFRMFYLFDTCRHFFFGTTIDNHGTFSTQAACSTH